MDSQDSEDKQTVMTDLTNGGSLFNGCICCGSNILHTNNSASSLKVV